MKKSVMIIGGSGLVGSTLSNYLKNEFDIHLTYNESNINSIHPSLHLNLLNERKNLSKIIKNINPDFIINTVAYPSVDFCETHKDDATLLHVAISNDLVSICSDIDSSLIYFSTDAVFDGKKQGKYNENDLTNPQSHYGITKLEAEKLILQNKKNIVLRTTVIYGWYPCSRFTNWVLKNLQENIHVPAFTDQYNTPTLVDDLTKVLLKLLQQDHSGLYHCAGKSCLSRYEFAKKLALKFGYDENLIDPVISQGKQDAARPENGCLDSSKIEDLLNFEFSTIDEGIDLLFNSSVTEPKIF